MVKLAVYVVAAARSGDVVRLRAAVAPGGESVARPCRSPAASHADRMLAARRPREVLRRGERRAVDPRRPAGPEARS